MTYLCGWLFRNLHFLHHRPNAVKRTSIAAGSVGSFSFSFISQMQSSGRIKFYDIADWQLTVNFVDERPFLRAAQFSCKKYLTTFYLLAVHREGE